MFKKALVLTSILAVSACTYDKGGKVPEDLKNPTLTENVVKAGAFFDNSRLEKRSNSQFAKEKCIENGYKNYEGYAVSNWYTGGFMLFGIVPMSDSEKTAKIWCTK